ncbi:MAG: hypothetical protein ACM3SQ_05805, partial [Betaproteobacteria bacterium]
MKSLLCVLLLAVASVAFAATPAENPATMGVAAAAPASDKVGDLTDMPALRAAAKADKRALVSRALDLSATEAKRFWP